MRKIINISNFTNVNDKQHNKNKKIILFESDSKKILCFYVIFIINFYSNFHLICN